MNKPVMPCQWRANWKLRLVLLIQSYSENHCLLLRPGQIHLRR